MSSRRESSRISTCAAFSAPGRTAATGSAHLHYIIKANGYETLTTHIFDPDAPYINSDAVFGVKETLVARFDKAHYAARAQEHGFAGDVWEVDYDFVLARKGEG